MKRACLYVLITLLFVATAFAQHDVTLTFSSLDQDEFVNYFATIKVNEQTSKDVLTTSSYTLDLPEGTHNVEVILNSFTTPTPDFYGLREVKVDSSQQTDFFLFPIGHLQGSVLDANGNLVPRADLKFTCFPSVNIDYPTQTDATGFFTVPNIPAGDCSVVASTSRAADRAEFTVQQGQATTVELILEQKVAGGNLAVFIVVGVIILILALFLGWYLTRGSKKPEPATPKIPPELEPKLPKQTTAILETLSAKEKKSG